MRKRRWHKLAGNKAKQKPVEHVFVDIETRLHALNDTETEHRLWFGWAAHWQRRPDRDTDTVTYFRFETVDAFWAYLVGRVRPKNPLYVIAHNVQFDLGVMGVIDQLEQRGYDLYSPYIGGLSVIMRFRNGARKIVVLDNSNFFKGRLGDLGEMIGFPKHDVNPLKDPIALVDPYCRQDVTIILKLWQFYYRFIAAHDLGNWGPTIPSQAMHAYRHRFMLHDIVIHADDSALELEREAYHGGRCSVFWTGERDDGPFYKVDVNSMYPFVMAKNAFPSTLYGVRDNTSIQTLSQLLTRFDVVARVTVNTTNPVYPVPYKTHLYYPVGRFDATLTTPEVRFAIENGHLEAVHRIALYERQPLFVDYVEYFYNLKVKYTIDQNETMRLFTKLYLNSLYGKFGQRSIAWEIIDDPVPALFRCSFVRDHDTGERWQLYQFGSRLWRTRPDGEAGNSFPAIAAHVCAYARLYLWELILAAGREHVLYVDTDSLIVTQKGLDGLTGYLDNDRLGALKIEKTSKSVEIRAPKVYRLDTQWKRKGVGKQARYLGNNTWQDMHWSSFRSMNTPGKKKPFVTTLVRKKLSYTIHDGTPQADGWVSPTPASTISPERSLSLDAEVRVGEIEMMIHAMKETMPVDSQTVFQLWDFRSGTFKRQRGKGGVLRALEYSNADSLATELGFDNLSDLKQGVNKTLQIRQQISDLKEERSAILYPAPESIDTTPLPF